MKMILLHGWVRRNSTKDCVDTSVEITGIINSVIQKIKWLKFGATLIVSLVKEKQSNAATFRELNYFITNIRNSEFQIVNKIKVI